MSVLPISRLLGCILFSASVSVLADATKEDTDRLKAEADYLNAQAALETAKVKAEYAREAALKEIYGKSEGKAGTIAVGEQKVSLMQVQTAGAVAVAELVGRACRHWKAGRTSPLILLTDAQAKSILEVRAFAGSLSALEQELKTALVAASGRAASSEGLPLLADLPVYANAVVSVLKLFRTDMALGVLTDNPAFLALLQDLLLVTPDCATAVSAPDQQNIQLEALKISVTLQQRRAADVQLVNEATKLAKEHEKDTGDTWTRLRVATEALKTALGTLAPSGTASKLGDYAAAFAIDAFVAKKPRLTITAQTQQVQVTRDNIFTGHTLASIGSAQLFYRIADDNGLSEAGYIEYSTPQRWLDVKSETSYVLSVTKPAATAPSQVPAKGSANVPPPK